jgi:hypothetical protein
MKFKDILAGAATLTSIAFPALAPVIGLVNKLLPDDKKLPEDATGNDVQAVVDTLPPEQQASLMEREIDLKIKQEEGWTERYKAMCSADGQETRAKVVIMLTKVLCFEILAFTGLFFWHPEILSNSSVWVVFGTLTAVPAATIGKYFGELRREHGQRQVSAGADPKAMSGLGVLAKLIPWGK